MELVDVLAPVPSLLVELPALDGLLSVMSLTLELVLSKERRLSLPPSSQSSSLILDVSGEDDSPVVATTPSTRVAFCCSCCCFRFFSREVDLDDDLRDFLLDGG